MKKIPLGNTNLAVSPLCFGTLPFSPLQGYTQGNGAEILCYAFELGVNFLDTAQFYKNYPVIKKALAKTTKELVMASKTYAYTFENALAAVEEARREMGRDYIDIFLLHEQESKHTLQGHAPALDALYAEKAAGRIRAVGLSTHHVTGVRAAIEARLDVVHPLLNKDGIGIADGTREEMETAVLEAQRAGLGVYTMKILGGGLLHKEAEACFQYAKQFGHSAALGMRDFAEVETAVKFFGEGKYSPLKEKTPRRLHIANWCNGCARCVEHCSSGALQIKSGQAEVLQNCVLCGYCGAACPLFCIKIV